MKTYSVDILGIKSNIDDGFIFNVEWTAYIIYDGLSEDSGYYTVYEKGVSEFTYTDNNFTPFAELDENTVKSWVLSSPEYSQVVSHLETKLDSLMQEPMFSEEIPWITPTVPDEEAPQ